MQELHVVARTCRLIIIKFSVSNISARILVLQPTGQTATCQVEVCRRWEFPWVPWDSHGNGNKGAMGMGMGMGIS